MMSEQENLAVIRAWIDAINSGDVDAELACWQPDGEYLVVPTGTKYRGIDQIREAGRRSASLVAGQPTAGRKRITHLEAGENWACVSYDVHATIGGPVVVDGITLIAEANQRTVVTRACVVFEMRGGKIQKGTEYFDPSALARQLGLHDTELRLVYASLAAHTSAAATTSTTPTAADVVAKFFQSWNARNLDALEALLAPQVLGRNPLSTREVALDRQAVRRAVEQNMAAFPDLRMEIDSLVADGGTVAVEETETATLATTNTTYTMAVSCFLRVNQAGQITHIHNYWDTDTFFRQLNIGRETLSAILGPSIGGEDGR